MGKKRKKASNTVQYVTNESKHCLVRSSLKTFSPQIIIWLLQKKAKNIQTHFMQGTSFQWTASIYTYLGMAQLLPLFLEGPHFPVGPP